MLPAERMKPFQATGWLVVDDVAWPGLPDGAHRP